MDTKIKKIAVIGAGTMGHGIAQVIAQSEPEVVLIDISKEMLDKALNRIKSNLDLFIETGIFDSVTAKNILAKINTETDLNKGIKDVDLIIEAITEDINLKEKLYNKLDQIASKEVIFASNTSSLSILDLASFTNRKDKVIGMHWFTPPTLTPLIEVVKTPFTSEDTIESIVSLSKKLGKVPVVCKDSPGFIVNRVIQAMGLEALSILEEGLVATPEELDSAIRFSFGLRLPFTGPARIVDLGGADVWLAVSKNLYEKLGHPKFKAPKILEEKVKNNELGVKTKKGFYNYTEEDMANAVRERDLSLIKILKQLNFFK